MINVQLMDYTGQGFSMPADRAARLLALIKNTRVSRGEARTKVNMMSHAELSEELQYVANTIRSSWEFIHYTFEISGISRACCDQMVRSRHASFAVQAQRVVDQGSFNYITPETIKTHPELADQFHEHIISVREFYRKMIEAGIPAQDARAVMPMCAESPLTAGYNLRALADVCAKRSNLRAQGEYQEVAQLMKQAVLDVHPWAGMFLEPERTKTPALDAILRDILGSKGPLDNPQLNAALKEVDALKGVWG